MRSLLAALLLFVGSVPHALGEVRSWNFRVTLDGREIGQHRFTLTTTGDARELRSEARFDVRVLFVSAYRYFHEAVERWNGGCLDSLVARTETNGERQDVSASARGDRLVVERPDRRDEHRGCVMSFAYWNPGILQAHALLNSQTGELVPVTITAQGDDRVEVRGRTLSAQRHRIVAPNLRIDLWYADGQWVALEAPAQGGRRLRYELTGA
jgi:hypothetical protein